MTIGANVGSWSGVARRGRVFNMSMRAGDLSDYAMEHMRALRALNAGGKYLFPKDTKEGLPRSTRLRVR